MLNNRVVAWHVRH